MRNGPCGGITPEKNCYVDETRKCVWYAIYKRAQKTGRKETLLEVLPPLDWNKVGTETWGDVVRQIGKVGTGRFIKGVLSKDKARKVKSGIVFLKQSASPNGGRVIQNIIRSACGEPVSEFRKTSGER